MSDHWEVLPDLTWTRLDSMVQEGRSLIDDLQRSIRQHLKGSSTYRQTAKLKDEVLAHLRWSTPLSQDTRVPLPVEWDYRHMVALLELGRLLNDHARSSDHSGHQISLPPVSALTCLLQLLVFFKPGGVLLREVSISPYCVVDKKQYYRLVSSAFVHIDATHLISNLTAALPDLIQLEQQEGSAVLAADLALITISSHLLYVGFSWLQKEAFFRRYNYYSLATVGFSGALFGLKVWSGFSRGGVVYVWGVPVPSRFSWAPTLALTHLCVPQASFPAHIAGVVAGVLRAYCLEPVIAWWKSRRRWARHGRQAGNSHQSLEKQRRQLSSSSIADSQPSNQQQLSSSSHQQEDWRLLHHERWLQQQEQEQANSSSSSKHPQQPSQKAFTSNVVQLAVNATEAAGAAASSNRHRQALSFGGDRLSVRRLLLDAGLQMVLAATAAGLYFVLSKSERPNRGGFMAAPWRL